MKNVFGLPWEAADGSKGKLQFRIVRQYPMKNGSICYVIQVYECFGDFKTGVLIQEYSGFYNRQRDIFILYPRKFQNPSFLNYPFIRHEVSPFWVINSTYSVMREVGEDIDLDHIF